MAATLKNFLVPHDDTQGKLVVERLRAFAKEAKISLGMQYVVIDEKAGRAGHIISLNARTMTAGRKLKQFADKIDRSYHY